MTLLFFVVGLAVGSFLNSCIDRLPRGQSLFSPPSHCPQCGHRLGVFDLVPLLNYLWLRGRCRYCSAPIPARLPIVEALTGILFALFWLQYGLNPQLLFALFFASLFLVIFFIDLEQGLILNLLVYPGVALALGLSFFWPGLGVASALIGGVLGAVVFLIPFLATRGEGMGAGDVKLGGLIGLVVGFPQILVSLLLGIVGGGLVALFLLAARRKGRKDTIPFGPFLAGAAIITLLWGRILLEWYLSLFVR